MEPPQWVAKNKQQGVELLVLTSNCCAETFASKKSISEIGKWADNGGKQSQMCRRCVVNGRWISKEGNSRRKQRLRHGGKTAMQSNCGEEQHFRLHTCHSEMSVHFHIVIGNTLQCRRSSRPHSLSFVALSCTRLQPDKIYHQWQCVLLFNEVSSL